MLEGYRAVVPLPSDATAEARILWHHLLFAIFGLHCVPIQKRSWIEQRLVRLRAGIQDFLSSQTSTHSFTSIAQLYEDVTTGIIHIQ
jgi:hypothetical protein